MTLPLPGRVADPATQRALDIIAQQFPLGPQHLRADASPYAVRVVSSADLILTNAYQDVAGATHTTTQAGTFLCVGTFDFSATVVGGVGSVGQLLADGAAQTTLASFAPNDDLGESTVSQSWVVALATAKVLKLQAKKLINAGTATCLSANTGLSILRIA